MISSIFIFIFILAILVIIYNYLNIDKIENFISPIMTKIKGFNSQINPELNSLKRQEMAEVAQRILFNNRDYNENLTVNNKNNKFFYNDSIDQSKINETAFNIIYNIDPIDFSDVRTGIEKCNKKCGGICFENGYDGIATCYPLNPQGFDWGTLYKNPIFTFGYNAHSQENLPQ